MSDLILCEICDEYVPYDKATDTLACGHSPTGEDTLDEEYDGGYRPLNFEE